MPFYDYYCSANGKTIEVKHEISKKISTWKELCELANLELGETPVNSKVDRLISAPQIQSTPGNSRLKELGFTKLVKKEKGVYENVTATGHEKKIVKLNDPSSLPNLNKKIKD